jgi:hypothetical protein
MQYPKAPIKEKLNVTQYISKVKKEDKNNGKKD